MRHNSAESTYSKEEITDIVGDEYCQSHVCEVEAITGRNQSKRDNVVSNQLIVILPWFLHSQAEHNELLEPVRCLEQVVELEICLVCPVREIHVHARGVEIPHRASAHHIQSAWSQEHKVYRSVHLLHETGLLCPALQSTASCKWSQEPLHNKFSSKTQNDSVEGHKCHIPVSFPILGRSVCRGLRVIR